MIIIDGARQGDDDRWSHFKSRDEQQSEPGRMDGSKFLKLHCGKNEKRKCFKKQGPSNIICSQNN